MRRRGFLVASIASVFAVRAGAAEPAPPDGPPVVLELFTSQGCSSCPPADALLGRLLRRPGVIALAWHVDYWDRLGWRDPFSSRHATERQQAYAARLNAAVYTPALVIGGARAVVGSDRSAVEAAIGAVAKSAEARVSVRLTRTPTGIIAEIGANPDHGSCPVGWCRSIVPGQRWLLGQFARAGKLTIGSSFKGVMVSSVL